MITVRATWEAWDSKHKEESCHVVVTGPAGLKAEGWLYIPDDDQKPYWAWVKCQPGPYMDCVPVWLMPHYRELTQDLCVNVDDAGKVLEFTM